MFPLLTFPFYHWNRGILWLYREKTGNGMFILPFYHDIVEGTYLFVYYLIIISELIIIEHDNGLISKAMDAFIARFSLSHLCFYSLHVVL